jgi:hypothetical protein
LASQVVENQRVHKNSDEDLSDIENGRNLVEHAGDLSTPEKPAVAKEQPQKGADLGRQTGEGLGERS